MLNIEERFDRAEAFAREGRLIQGVWHKINKGRKLACALGAFGDDIDDPDMCPAEIGPEWAMRLIVPMFDGLTGVALADFTRRYVPALRGMRGKDGAAWRRVQVEVLLASLRVALPHDRSNVVQPVIVLLEREKCGGTVGADEWNAAAARAAWAAGSAAEADAAAWASISDAFLTAMEREAAVIAAECRSGGCSSERTE